MFTSPIQENLYNELNETIEGNENRDITTAILKGASKDDLLKVLTTADITKESISDQEYTLTLLGLAIARKDQESIKAIFDVAKEQNILKDILTIANIIVKSPGGQEYTLTLLGLAIARKDQKSIKAIFDVAKEQNN